MREIRARHPECRIAYLKVSEGDVFLEPTLVQTVLGSCLGGVFYSRPRKIGALFHAFLPIQENWLGVRSPTVFTFVDTAIEHVLERFSQLGVRPATLEISLVGGANGLVDESSGMGLKNVRAAVEVLQRHRLHAGFKDVGGDKGRRVTFVSSTGELEVAMLQGIPPQKLDEPARRRLAGAR